MTRNDKIALAASAVIAASLPTIALIKGIKDKKFAKKLTAKSETIKTVAFIANTLTA